MSSSDTMMCTPMMMPVSIERTSEMQQVRESGGSSWT